LSQPTSAQENNVKQTFMNLEMAKKLMLPTLVSVLFMMLMGFVGYNGVRVQEKSLVDIYDVRFKTYQTCATEFTAITEVHSQLYKLISWATAKFDEKKIAALGQDVQKSLKKSLQTLTTLQNAKETSAAEKKLLQPLLGKLAAYNAGATDMIDMIQTDANAATMFMSGADDIYQDMNKSLNELLALEKSLSSTRYAAAMASSSQTNTLGIVVLVASLILSFVISIFLQGIILAPVKKTVAIIETVATGDFTKRIDIDSQDEIGQMAGNFNQLIDKLSSILREVAANSTSIASAASSLHASSDQSAVGAEEVVSQASTVATASEEMSATSQDIAQSCHLAAAKGHEATSSATSGAAVVEETVKGMERIAGRVKTSAKTVESLGQRSNQIGEIIGTIEDIADQTNLLALNAAIEAARAGEQGRGFAVVADEVRALAERTTRATKEIGDMIKSIQNETKAAVGAMEEGVKEVESGTQRAAKSGEALQEILHHINDVTMQVNQIATAAEEQTATTGEISNNIQHITEVVSQSARGAQESASSAAQLSQLAGELKRLVSQFKLA
jgi:methyl-accepting chemotaxis protein